GRDPAHHHGRAPLSEVRRVLLPGGAFAGDPGDARAVAPRYRARGAQERGHSPFPAAARRARSRRDHLERLVRSLGAARCACADARPSRLAVPGGQAMRGARNAAVIGLLAAVLMLAGCDRAAEGVYQGWVEADLVFVGPDETGRIETLSVREGDTVA